MSGAATGLRTTKTLFVLLLFATCQEAVAAQECSFRDEMDDIQRIRGCMQRLGTTRWTNPNGFTMLHRAARYSSNSAVVSVILDTGFNPNARDDSGWTPLHYAVHFNENHVVSSVLVEAGADPDVRNDDGDTPLHIAVFNAAYGDSEDRQLVSILLDGGADPNIRDDDGDTPLHTAVFNAAYGDSEDRQLVSILLDGGADPNIRDDDGDTPLHTAVFRAAYGDSENSQLVSILLDGGADPNIRDDDGDTPLHTAVLRAAYGGESEHRQLVSILMDGGADPNVKNADGDPPLLHAIASGDLRLLSALLNAGADPNVKNADGDPPLLHAIASGDLRLLSALLNAGADPNVKNADGDPPLHRAIASGDLRLVSALLNAGADPVGKSASGRYPIHSAAYYADDRALVTTLLRRGAGAELSAAHVAVLNGDRLELATALEEVAGPDVTDNYGWTPLHFAALAGRWTDGPLLIIEDLLAAGADTGTRDFFGLAPLDLLSRYGGRASAAALLMRAGSPASSRQGMVADPTASAARPNVSEVFRDCTMCPEMVVIPAGSFMMGSPDSLYIDEEKPRHRVNISANFAVGMHEVTFAQWDACALAGGCADHWPGDEDWGRGERPVVNASWDDASAYVAWLSEQMGEQYRLLSEAEWEYLARAGTDTEWYWGNNESEYCRHVNAASGADCPDGYENTAPVGSFPPNGFGLHDVLGNVWEWTADCWNDNYSGAPTNGGAWQSGDCSQRVRRGGSWVNRLISSTRRVGEQAAVRAHGLGFRVAKNMN